jgi:hypothetical protein
MKGIVDIINRKQNNYALRFKAINLTGIYSPSNRQTIVLETTYVKYF